jgi:tetratricopeptide (TPR) repeat protein
MPKILLCLVGTFLLQAGALGQESTNALPKPKQPAIEPSDAKQKEPSEARSEAQSLIDHARVDMEKGRFEEAEKKLRGALELDPTLRAASYYLTLIRERKVARKKARVQQIDASVKPVYPLIKNYDGTLHYGVPAYKSRMRELADDLGR